MADELVRAHIGDRIKNVGAAFAQKHGLEVVEESPLRGDGSLRPETRGNGRRVKRKTTVAQEAAAKEAASADTEKADSEPAETAEEANG